ncbi:MAG: hypothetical protein A2687_04070 [Candidatus Levybacteria bacterium RIFCSPHIGHO2_01_FULL_38_26]|nr:MAG: hypothetical protein A2687_04070 [Candidatus Levybacteria bacterium RIFCSPHIGHO2_01_FULL_38_26]
METSNNFRARWMRELDKNTVVVIGGTGREHALVDSYAKSPNVERVICIPGNPLMEKNSQKEVTIFQSYDGKRLRTTDKKEIIEICKANGVTFADVAQDDAVAAGVADATRSIGIPTIGFGERAAILEADKAYSRDFCREYGIPIPDYEVFTSKAAGIRYLRNAPDIKRAIKAAYLAGGKGVISGENNKDTARKIGRLRGSFPQAAKKYLLEEWMLNDDGTPGEEFSAFFIFDGNNWESLGDAQDYKLEGVGDTGENTGSMGGNSPTLIYTDEVRGQAEEIAEKTFSGLKEKRLASPGILYVSGMVLVQRGRKLVKLTEHNMRFGDPEGQLIASGMENFWETMWAAGNGDLDNIHVKRDGKKRVDIAGMANGYPRDYSAVVGMEVFGVDDAMAVDGVRVFGAGIGKDASGKYRVSGTNGRIFHIVGEGEVDESFKDVRAKPLTGMSKVDIEGNNLRYRPDIAWQDIERERRLQY